MCSDEDEGTATWYEHKRSGKAQERAKRLRAKFRSRTERRRQVGKRARGHVDEEAMLHGRQLLSPPPPPPPPLPPAVNSARAAKRRRKANAAVNVVCARFAAAVCVEDKEELASYVECRLQVLHLGAKRQRVSSHAGAADTLCKESAVLEKSQALAALAGQDAKARPSRIGSLRLRSAKGNAQRRKKKPRSTRHYCRVV
jgi:hypothetical protein